MKRVLCLLLSLFTVVLSIPVIAFAEDSDIYKSVPVEYSDKPGTTEKLDVMIKDGKVYANAAKLTTRLGYNCDYNNSTITVTNKTNPNIPTAFVAFSSDTTVVKKMLLTVICNSYEAPFASVINDKGAWIPLEYSLLVLNSGMMMVDNCILIDIPQKNIIDCFVEAMQKGEEYRFDWSKDFGYTEWDQTVMGVDSHFVNMFSGLLSFDGYSWAELFQSFALDSSSYDSKFGKDLALLVCTQFDEEIKAAIDQMNLVTELIDEDGHLGTYLGLKSKLLNGTENETGSVEKLYNKCNDLLGEIKSGNSSSASKYNRTYREYEKAFDKQTWFSKTGENVMRVQSGLSDAARAIDVVSKIAEVVGYGKEFDNQDEFSVSALKEYLNNTSENSVLQKSTRESMKTYTDRLSEDVVTYSAKRFLDENVDDFITSAVSLGEALGSQANIALFAWNIASNVVPFISNGLSGTEKHELAMYAQIFQSDSYIKYQEKSNDVFTNTDQITAENLYSVSQLFYIYLKSCYITRCAALGSLIGKSGTTKDKVKPMIESQNKLNAKLAKLLNVVKNANDTNEDNVYGFLPEDNQKYLEEYDNSKLLSFMEKIKANDDSWKKLYIDYINNYTKDSQFNSAKFALALIDEDSIPELLLYPDYLPKPPELIWLKDGVIRNDNVVVTRYQEKSNKFWMINYISHGSSFASYQFKDDEIKTLHSTFENIGFNSYRVDGNEVSEYECHSMEKQIEAEAENGIEPIFKSKEEIIAEINNFNLGESSEIDSQIQDTITSNESLTLSGTLSSEDYVTNAGDNKTVMILNLDKPFDCYLNDGAFNYDGKTKYTIDSVQVDLKNSIGKHVTVQGKVLLAHTIHHRRDIVLLNCALV